MDPSSPVPDITAFYIQEIGALLFGMVFLFLYRQSRVVYFGLWAIAWVLRLLAAFFGFELLRTHALGLAGALRHLRIRLRDRADLGGARRLRFRHEGLAHGAAADRDSADLRGAGLGHRAVRGGWRRTTPRTPLVLGFVYFYNFLTLRQQQGMGSADLPLLAAAAGRRRSSSTPSFCCTSTSTAARRAWAAYLHHETYLDFALHCVLAFSAMAMWSESQIDRMRDLAGEAGLTCAASAPRRSIWTA